MKNSAKRVFAALGVLVAPGTFAQDNATAVQAAAPAGLAPTAGIGQPVDGKLGLQPMVSPIGEQGLWMHDWVLMPIITAISLFVLGLLVWVIVRYRRAANPVPSKTSHNTLIEVVWTLVPVLILVGIAIPSISLLAAQYKPLGKDALTIKAIGNQWYWSYQYPDHGGFEITANMLPDDVAKARGEPRLLAVDNRVVVPVGTPVRLLVTANDVIHSWTVPAFWVKMDAVPGRVNETSFTVEKPGVYYGQCSELCGARHAFMPIAVEAVSREQFAAWIASKGGTMPGAAPKPSDALVGQPSTEAQKNPAGAPTAPTVPVTTPAADPAATK